MTRDEYLDSDSGIRLTTREAVTLRMIIRRMDKTLKFHEPSRSCIHEAHQPIMWRLIGSTLEEIGLRTDGSYTPLNGVTDPDEDPTMVYADSLGD